MADVPKTQKCQFPKSARKAALLYFGPAYPVTIKIDDSQGKGAYGLDTKSATITAPDPNIPFPVYADLVSSHLPSLGEELKRLGSDSYLEKCYPRFGECISQIHSKVKTIVECGLHDKEIPKDVTEELYKNTDTLRRGASEVLLHLQSHPQVAQTIRLNPQRLDHLAKQVENIQSSILMEQQEQKRGRRHG